jgi:hypothetical protein
VLGIRNCLRSPVIVLFELITEALEELTVGRGRQATRDPRTLPETTKRMTASDFDALSVFSLVPGD